MKKFTFHCIGMILLGLMALAPRSAPALEYPYQTAEPQKNGWPQTEAEKHYVLKAEHERRPGRERLSRAEDLVRQGYGACTDRDTQTKRHYENCGGVGCGCARRHAVSLRPLQCWPPAPEPRRI